MVTIRLIWRAIFIRFSYPCVVTDVLADVMLELGVDMFPDMDIIVMTTPAITLEFVGEADVVDVPASVLAVVLVVMIIDAVPAIDVDMLDNENVNILVALMTPLEFTLPASREESIPFC